MDKRRKPSRAKDVLNMDRTQPIAYRAPVLPLNHFLFYLTFQLGRERINVIIKGAETGEYR